MKKSLSKNSKKSPAKRFFKRTFHSVIPARFAARRAKAGIQSSKNIYGSRTGKPFFEVKETKKPIPRIKIDSSLLKIGQAAKALGVSIDTLRRWEKSGKITATRTPGRTRLYSLSDLKKVNPSVETYQIGSLSTEELLKKTEFEKDTILGYKDTTRTEGSPSIPVSQYPSIPTKSSLVTKVLISSAFLSVVILAFASWITVSNFTSKNEPPPPMLVKQQPSNNSAVLAETTSSPFLEINSDTQINGSLFIRDSINGLTMEATASAGTMEFIAGETTLTVTKSTLLDQDVSTTASPAFVALNLSSGGATGTLTWTPTAARVITLPNATTTLVGKDTTDILTNKSISGSSNTLTNIPNSALTNSKVTVTAGTNLSGGGDVTLGSSVTLSLASSPAISGVLTLADGTAAAPALTFTSDTNTGLYRIGADKIGLITGGSATSGLTIDSSGNLGIGTISPAATLSVSGNAGIGWTGSNPIMPGLGLSVFGSVGIGTTSPTANLHVIGTGTFTSTLTASNGFNQTTGALNLTATSGAANLALSPSTTAFTVNGLFGIDTTNNRVGIGTTAPQVALQVLGGNVGIGTSAAGASIQVNGGGLFGWGTASVAGPANGLAVSGNVGIGTTTANSNLSVAGNAHIGTLYQGTAAPANGLFVDGNVGIGATTSSNKLDVWGNTRISGTLLADGNTTIGGTLGLTGAATLTSTLAVSGITTLSASNGALSFTGATPSLTSGGSVFGIFAGGNVGIGTTANLYGGLTVRGAGTGTNITFQTYGSGLGQGLSVLDNGNVGIGNTSPGAALGVNGAGLFGTFSSAVAPANGLAVSGNVGIGTTTANSNLSVAGNAHIGTLYQGTSAPANGLFVDGNVGIGATTSSNKLDVWGNTRVAGTLTVDSTSTFGGNFTLNPGAQFLAANGISSLPSYSFTNSTSTGMYSPSTNALALNTNGASTPPLTITAGGNVGIGITNPVGTLQVNGTAAIGYGSIPTSSLPANGLAVSGNVGIGTTSPAANLHVVGTSQFNGNSTSYGNILAGADTTYDLGSAAVRWNNLYVYTITATNVAGTVTGGSTSSSDWLINSTNTSDSANSSVSFKRGSATNAVLQWYGSNNTFDFNSGIRIGMNSGSASSIESTTGLVLSGFGNDITTGTNEHLSLIPNGTGNVGVGTSSPLSLLSVAGNAHIGGLYQSISAPANGMFVDGNVGIGATTSSNKLDVWGNSRLAGTLAVDGATTLTSTLAVSGITTLSASNGALSFTGSTPSLTSGASLFGIFAGGNVGIGTTGNLYGALTVRGAGTGTNITFQTYGSGLGQGLTVLDNGNVGIGTTNPTFQLQTTGNVGIGTSLTVTNVSALSGGLKVTGFSDLTGNVGIGNSLTTTGLTVANGGLNVNGFSNLTGNVGIGTSLTVSSAAILDSLSVTKSVSAATLGTSGNVGVGGSLTLTSAGVFSSGLAVSGFTSLADARLASLIATGNIGIGATTSSNKLDVWGNARISGTLTIDQTSTFGGNLTLTGNLLPSIDDTYDLGSNTARWANVYVGPSTVHLGTSTSDEYTLAYDTTNNRLGFNVNGSGPAEIVMDSSGNVGIGITNPGAMFSVSGNGIFGFGGATSIAGPANGLGISGNLGVGATTANSNLSVVGNAHIGGLYQSISAPTNGLFVDGNVGIGATTSSNKLDVWGNARLAGTLAVDGATTLTSTLAVSGVTTLSASNGALSFTGSTPSLTSGGSVFGLFAGGNVGIGTTANLYGGLTVRGAGTGTNIALQTYGSGLGQGLTVLDNGNVGIGTTSPTYQLQTTGNVGVGGSLTLTSAGVFSSGLAVSGFTSLADARLASLIATGNIGIGATTSSNKLDVWGNTRLAGTLAVDGATTLTSTLAVSGVTTLSASNGALSFTGSTPSITSGASLFGIFAGGNVGIGTTGNLYGALTVRGAGTGTNITFQTYGSGLGQGLTVLDNGNVGIGTTNPSFQLQTTGNVGIGTSLTVTSVSALSGGLKVTGFSDLTGNVGIGNSLTTTGLTVANGGLNVNGFSNLTGNVGIGTSLTVSSAAILDSLSVTKSVSAATLGTSGNVGVGGSLTLTSAGVFSSGLAVSGFTSLADARLASLIATGNIGIGATTSSNKLDVWGNTRISGTLLADGNTTIGGTLGLTGAATLTSTLAVSGITTLSASNGALSFTGATPSLTSGGSVFGIFAGGNVGIGTTANVAGAFTVRGLGTGTNIALQTFGSDLRPGLSALDNGNVGVGTTTPGARLTVLGGNVGIGTSAAGAGIQVNGGGLFGWGTASVAAPADGLGILGNVGIGTSSSASNLTVAGNVHIGTLYQGTAAPANGLFVDGNVGIGATTSNNPLDVWGNARISGNLTLDGTLTTNGTITPSGQILAIDGSKTAPSYSFASSGNGDNGIYLPSANALSFATAGNDVLTITAGGNVGIGTTAPLAKFHNAGGTLFGTLAVSDLASGGNIGTAATTVDIYTSFNLTQTTASQTITLADPTNTTAGRIVYLSNTGTTPFTFYGSTVKVGDTTAAMWDGNSWNLAGGGGLNQGTVNNSTLRWNADSSQWVENANVLSASNGAFGINGNLGVGTTASSLDYNMKVLGTGYFSGFVGVGSSLNVSGNVGIGTSLTVTSVSALSGGLKVTGFSDLTGNVGIGTSLTVSSAAILDSLSVTKSISAATLGTSGNVGIGGSLTLTSAGVFSSGLAVSGFTSLADARLASLIATGNIGIGATTSSNKLDVWGNARLAGTLAVDGATTLSSTLAVSGVTTLSAGNGALSFTGATPSLTSGGSVFGIFAGGNVGIGTTGDLLGGLTVRGAGTGTNITFQTYGSGLGQGLTVLDNGNVGIGTTNPSFQLQATGNVGIGSSLTVTNVSALSGGLKVTGFSDLTGNVGIGNSLTTTGLTVANGGLNVNGFSNLTGNVGIGTSLTVSSAAILDSLSVTKSISSSTIGTSGNVGVGGSLTLTSAGVFSSGLAVSGFTSLADARLASLIATGNIGIGATTSSNKLDVWGNSRLAGTLAVDGATTLSSTLGVTGALTLSANNAALSFTGSTPSLTSGGSVFGLFAGGNVGIGTTANLYGGLTVRGAGTGTNIALQTYGSGLGQGLTVLDNGNVGIGTTNPTFQLQTTGNVGIGTSLTVTNVSALNGGLKVTGFSDLTGNVGIGGSLTLTSAGVFSSGLAVSGFTSLADARLASLIATGNIGIGATTSSNKLDVWGNSRLAGTLTVDQATTLSAPNGALSFTGSTPSLTSGGSVFGIFAGGNVGIGTTGNLLGALTVRGSGTGTNIALQTYGSGLGQGLSVLDNGNVGIGTTNPTSQLQTTGNVGIGSSLTVTNVSALNGGLKVTGFSDLTGNVGIGTSLTVSSAAILDSLSVTKSISAATLGTSGNVGIGGSLTLTSAGVFNSGLTVSGFTSLADARLASLIATGNIGIGATTSSNKLDVWGNSRLAGTLAVDGATTLSSTLAVSGITTLSASNGALSFTGSTPSLTSGGSVFGLFAGGNVGIGTTANLYGGLTVRGAGTSTGITLQTYGSGLGQGLSVLDNGNVGIGNTSPGAPLGVNGAGLFGTFSSAVAPTNGLAVSGNVGVGTTTANSNLSIAGSSHIGALYQGISAPANGLFVDGNVGIGATTSSNKLDVWGNSRLAGTLTVDSTSTFGKNFTLNPGAQFLGANGISSLPSYSFTNSTSTGMYSPSTNALALNTNGAATPPLTITAGGNVGIGITSPGALLDIAQSQTGNYLRLTRSDAPLQHLTIVGKNETNDGTGFTFLSQDYNGTTYDERQVLHLAAAGNVGIGTTSPGTALTVKPSTDVDIASFQDSAGVEMLRIGVSGTPTRKGWFGIYDESGNLDIRLTANSASSNYFNSGNVGIGNASPGYTLDVTGTLNVTGAVSCGSGCTAGPWVRATSPINVIIPATAGDSLGFLSGNVGIGTTSPSSTLVISGNLNIGYTGAISDALGLAVRGNVGIGTTTPLAPLHVWGNNTNSAFFLNGNVGIGTTVPTNTLDVKGTFGVSTSVSATGGTITTSGGYTIHTFTTTGTFTVNSAGTVEYLVVAGGGGGGGAGERAGGGGAGGMLTGTSAVTTQGYTVTVGNGGAAGTAGSQGTNGTNSVFSTITATGGGGGGGATPNVNGLSGGSGGGGASASAGSGSGGSGITSPQQGYAGGSGYYGAAPYSGGGGGGAGGTGVTASSGVKGDGGVGLSSNISGSTVWYAGGGGGGVNSGSVATGGTGGGGDGAYTGNATAGTTNTGGGGGGGSNQGGSAAAGGSGIVIIRYPTAGALNIVINSAGNIGIGISAPDRLTQLASDIDLTSSIASLLGAGGSQFSITGSSAAGFQKKLILGLDTTDNYGVIQAGNTDGTAYNLSLQPGGGNVGIGTAGPGQKLSVSGGHITVTNASVTDRGLDTTLSGARTTGSYGYVLANTSTSSTASIDKYGLYVESSGTWNGTSANNYGVYVAPSGGTTDWGLYVTGEDKNYFSGNVGIGTAEPGAKLDLRDGDLLLTDADVAHPMTSFIATNAYGTAHALSGTAGGLYFFGASDTDAIGLALEGAIGSSNPADTTPAITIAGMKSDGGTSRGVVADAETVLQIRNFNVNLMTILGNGNVGIGNINPLVKLDVEGTAECDGAGCWAVESDIAYKENILELDYGLAEIMRLQPKRYNLKATGEESIGMIAQEFELVIPELVRGIDGSKSIGYSGLAPVLVKAIQEQQGQISSLQTNQATTSAQLVSQGVSLGTQGYTLNKITGALTVADSGNVGIGTTAPSAKLQITGDTGQLLAINNSTSSLFNVSSSGNVGIGTSNPGYRLQVTGDSGNTVLAVASSGNVGIGTSNPQYTLEVNGTGKLNDASWTYASDLRLKENIASVSAGLSVIEKLNPVTFDYIDGGKNRSGFIAQEVQTILPNLVTVGSDGMLGIRLEELMPYAVKAIQEQQSQINNLIAQQATNSALLAGLSVDSNGTLNAPQIQTDHLTLATDINFTASALASLLTTNYQLPTTNSIDLLSSLDSISNAVLGIQTQESTTSARLATLEAERAKLADIESRVESQESRVQSLEEKLASVSAHLEGEQIAEATPSAETTSGVGFDSPEVSEVSELNLTPPDILLATDSAHLEGEIFKHLPGEVVSEATVSALLTAYDLNVQNSLKSFGQTTLGNTLVAGDLTVDGTMSISGNAVNSSGVSSGSPEVSGGILYLQNSSLAQGVDFFNGQVTIDKYGTLTAQTVTAKEVVTNKLTISNTPIATSSGVSSVPTDALSPEVGAASIGSGKLLAGQTKVAIFTNNITDTSKVFITPRSSTSGQAPFVELVEPGTGFVVSIDNTASRDIDFNWWIVETR